MSKVQYITYYTRTIWELYFTLMRYFHSLSAHESTMRARKIFVCKIFPHIVL